MKKMMLLLTLLFSTSIFAKQSFDLAPISLQISAENALSKFEQTILYPEGLLKRFQPVGAKVSQKWVSQNVISFVATKSVLFISKSVHVNGILDARVDQHSCSKGEVGYALKMHFDNSDRLVTDNVDALEAIICLQSHTLSKITGLVRAKVIKGNNYSTTLGPIAINLIKEQVAPLVLALTDEIRSLN